MAIALGLLAAEVAWAASLRPSRSSLNRQNRIARQHDFTFLNTPRDVRRFVAAGYLVPVSESRHLDLHRVSFPYARPEVDLFLGRLAEQYHRACGERLVVTSLTRPRNQQPRNASRRSVHPTGTAFDLRASRSHRCRAWLESTLLQLEDRGVLEASRERRPVHYHVALSPNQYVGYLARRGVPIPGGRTHRVVAGESLWQIARRHGLTVARLKELNGLRSDAIRPGQVLELSARRVHEVARGETLWEIARRYDTTVARLKSANGLRSETLRPGQELVLP